MKFLILCVIIAVASAQRGSYGGSRPITGSRYDTSNSAAPAQSNFAAPSQGVAPSSTPARGNTGNFQQQPQQPGIGGFGSGFPNGQGFQPYPFAPTGFNGR